MMRLSFLSDTKPVELERLIGKMERLLGAGKG
jgi:hypothetical protein